MAAAWRAWAATPDAWFAVLHGEILATPLTAAAGEADCGVRSDGVSTWEHLLVEDVEPITRITLNRPERRNALSLDLMRELQQALEGGRGTGGRHRRGRSGLLGGA